MKTVLLIADTCHDVYHMGHANRISPEAPVPIFIEDHQITHGGMGFNVQVNLENLGLKVVTIFGLPSVKNRYVDIKSKHQLLRVDEETYNAELMYDRVAQYINSTEFKFDAIVISDYDKGFISKKTIIDVGFASSNLGIKCFLDTKKKQISGFYNHIIKINEKEFLESDLTLSSIVTKNTIVTGSEKGARYKNNLYPVENIIDVHDVCGAGDTFLSALVYKYLQTESIEESIPFANKAAAVTVQKFGVYAPTLKEINDN